MAQFFLEIRTCTRTRGDDPFYLASQQSAVALCSTAGVRWGPHLGRPVIRSGISAPIQAPTWIYDRVQLWGAIDKQETRRDAQLCRRIQLLLPPELTVDQQESLVKEFANEQFTELGMVVDYALYTTLASTYGALLLSTRSMTPSGFGFKDRSWNNRLYASKWRLAWETIANQYLKDAGVASEHYIDRRSKEARAVDGVDTDEGPVMYITPLDEDGF
jgi:hypothetical protein